MDAVETWIQNAKFGVWYNVTPEQVEKLKPYTTLYGLCFDNEFTKVKKGAWQDPTFKTIQQIDYENKNRN